MILFLGPIVVYKISRPSLKYWKRDFLDLFSSSNYLVSIRNYFVVPTHAPGERLLAH